MVAASPWATLGLRMALVAAFVVVVAIVAERIGPFLGAMIASLPLYTGPVYLILALERDAAWFEQATLGSLAVCGIAPVFVLVYCALALRHGLAASLGIAVLIWIGAALGVQANRWSLAEALVFVAPIYGASVAMARGFTRGIAMPRTERRTSDLVLRAVLVALLSGFTIWISGHVPPQAAGVLSVAPVLTTSLVLVLHPRIGGPATAALLAHTLAGLVGMVVAFAAVHLLVVRIGVFAALAAGLAITVGWNLMLIAISAARRNRPAPTPRTAPSRPTAGAAPARPLPPPAVPPRRR